MFTVFTFYWDQLQLQKRKHCEDQITLRPICPGFVHLVTVGNQVGKTSKVKGTQQQSEPPQAKRHELSWRMCLPSSFVLAVTRLFSQKEKLLCKWELTTVQCAADVVNLLIPPWNPVSWVGNRLPLIFSHPRKLYASSGMCMLSFRLS